VVLIEIRIDWTEERIIKELRDTFPETPNTAVAIARCESSLKMVQSYQTLDYGREQSYGIMQIHAKDHESNAIALGLSEYKTDVGENIKMARHIYDDAGGWSPWTCYTKGMYWNYLD